MDQEVIQAADVVREKLTRICNALYDRYGRPPTEEEVNAFVLGTNEERAILWNLGRD